MIPLSIFPAVQGLRSGWLSALAKLLSFLVRLLKNRIDDLVDAFCDWPIWVKL